MSHIKHIVKEGQDLFDIAALYYGNPEEFTRLLQEPQNDFNEGTNILTKPTGSVIYVPHPEVGDPAVKEFWRKSKLEPSNLSGVDKPTNAWFKKSALFNGLNSGLTRTQAVASKQWGSHHVGTIVALVKPYPRATKPDTSNAYSIFTGGGTTACNTLDQHNLRLINSTTQEDLRFDYRGCAFSGGDGAVRNGTSNEIGAVENKWKLLAFSSNGSRTRFSRDGTLDVGIDTSTADVGKWFADYDFRNNTAYRYSWGYRGLAVIGVSNHQKDYFFYGLIGYFMVLDKELSLSEWADLYASGEFADPRGLSFAGNILDLHTPGDDLGNSIYGSEPYNYGTIGTIATVDETPFPSIE